MDAPQFQQELMTVRSSLYAMGIWLTLQEYSDVQLTNYLTTLTKQLDALNDVSIPSHIRRDLKLTTSMPTSILSCIWTVAVMIRETRDSGDLAKPAQDFYP
jgi:hypothetical protein